MNFGKILSPTIMLWFSQYILEHDASCTQNLTILTYGPMNYFTNVPTKALKEFVVNSHVKISIFLMNRLQCTIQYSTIHRIIQWQCSHCRFGVSVYANERETVWYKCMKLGHCPTVSFDRIGFPISYFIHH